MTSWRILRTCYRKAIFAITWSFAITPRPFLRLLKAIGGDTASGFTLLAPDESPALPHYLPTHWTTVAEHLHQRKPGLYFRHRAAKRAFHSLALKTNYC